MWLGASRSGCAGLALTLLACATPPAPRPGAISPSTAALDYYPLLPGWGWAYEIEREGTKVLALYAVAERRADVAVIQHGEERIEYRILPDGIARREGGLPGDYLLKMPMRVGASWPVRDGTATFAEVGKTVSLPSGDFHECAVVEEVRREPDRVTRTTYCRNAGPVEIELRVFSPLTRAYEVHAHARIMSVSRPEDAAAN
jgi:hypothetical protein